LRIARAGNLVCPRPAIWLNLGRSEIHKNFVTSGTPPPLPKCFHLLLTRSVKCKIRCRLSGRFHRSSGAIKARSSTRNHQGPQHEIKNPCVKKNLLVEHQHLQLQL
jgi:hypothetical protein